MYKKIVPLFISILCFIGCEEVPLEKAPQVTREFVNISSDPVLVSLREEVRSKVNNSSSSRITSDWLDNAQWKRVYHVYDEFSSLSTYTVPVGNEKPDVLDLLVINTRDGSSNYRVFSLVANVAWLNEKGGFTGMSDFSGQVEVADLNGKVWISSPYENGQRVNRGNSTTGKTAACETWIDVDWTEVCVEGTCTISEIIITEYELCNEGGGTGGGGPLDDPSGDGDNQGGGGGGNGNGGGTSNGPIGFDDQPLCIGGQEIDNGICVDKCPSDHVRDDNGRCVQQNALSEIANPDCLELNSSEKTQLENVILEYKENCFRQQIFDYMSANDHNYCFKIGSQNGEPGSFNYLTQTISFKNIFSINSTTFEEEFFHAYQDKFYTELSQYTEDGRSNIEFEAKLFYDMTHGGICCLVFSNSTVQQEYLLWLDEITDGFTRIPEWNEFSNNYFRYLEEFVIDKPLYDFPINYELQPGALLSINNC
ncbi:MAG: hypothetical protein AAF843_15170 [Bacteroidota bacterium]